MFSQVRWLTPGSRVLRVYFAEVRGLIFCLIMNGGLVGNIIKDLGHPGKACGDGLWKNLAGG